MKVTFEGGPLDGRTEEIADDRLEEGAAVLLAVRGRAQGRGPRHAGARGAVEYLYGGDGKATYVGGQLS